jgi:hypothetical protein
MLIGFEKYIPGWKEDHMCSLFRTIFSAMTPTSRKPRIYLDASSFDPEKAHKNGRAVLIITHNQENMIFERVQEELKCASGVVVLDQCSEDATPHLAAQAGAIVVLQEPGQTEEKALEMAMNVARRFSNNIIQVRCL